MLDWRPELFRITSIMIIVTFHLVFYSGNLVSDITNPLILISGYAMGAFFVCSGYVNGLKGEFNKPGSLNRSTYVNFLKRRFSRLYIGYFIALVVVFIAKNLAGYTIIFSNSASLTFGYQNPLIITPTTLVLDISSLWPLITANSGGIWPEGWFIGTIMLLSLSYPFLARLHSNNKTIFYSIICIAIVIRIIVAIFINYKGAYYFPFAWTAEFSLGIVWGNFIGTTGGPPSPKALYQRILIKIAVRVWPLYLVHMAAVVFLPIPASLSDFIITVVVILILTEILYHILKGINKIIRFKKN